MNKISEDIYKRALAREKASRKKAEKILEDKALELYNLTLQLQEVNAKLESKLSEKTSELEGVFENIVDAYVVIDISGNVLRMNNAAIDLLGYDVNKEAFNLLSLVHKNDLEYTTKVFQELYKKGSYTNYKARIFTKSKQPKLVHVNCSIIYNVEGKPIAAQGIVRDVTQETINKEIFEEQKRELDIIIDNSPVGIFLTINGYIIKSNNAFQELLGYESKDLMHKNISDFAVQTKIPAISEEFYKTHGDSSAGKSKIKTYQKKDGSLLIGRTIVNSVLDNNGNEKYQVGMIEDITNQIKESSTLKVLNSIMSSILGKTDLTEITWIIAENTMSLFGFEDCLIYTFDDNKEYLVPTAYGIKKEKREGYSPQMRIKLGMGVVGSVALTGKPEIVSDTSKDSRYIPDEIMNYSEITVPIISEGKVIGIIDSEHSSKNYFTNSHLETLISIANLAAAKLRHVLNLNLRKKAEQQRVELLKKLEVNNEQLKEFAHIVSHDLKSPLRSISALASWIHEDYEEKLDENGRNNLKMMQEKIQKMDHLIDGILRYSSIQNSRHIREEVAIDKILKDIVRTIFIPSHVKVKIVNEMPVIKADPIRMQQLFQNLISNAVNYANQEDGRVEVYCKEKKKYWEFAIKDNGIGIPEEYHKKIFKVFQSLGNHKDSTGIGLSIVKKIIDQYDGRIWLDSELNKGTTFYVTIKK
ncbi:PAS domain S-box protein [Ascidiimonas sp. W6]|uniref:PAS domain S-box protein n=1 Tax=Ascidiimonas meishanensis TaxID=3128903 RepID=UPI0030ED09F2